jgi:hypothetical protein
LKDFSFARLGYAISKRQWDEDLELLIAVMAAWIIRSEKARIL